MQKWVFLLSLFLVAPGVSAQTELTGQTQSGAFYRIVVPDNWNGDLVIFNHGFELTGEVSPNPSLGPLADMQLAQGFAVAASSYSQIGWALFGTRIDNPQLLGVFQRNFGPPDRLFITGISLGGAMVAQAVENPLMPPADGALSMCGAVGGDRNWNAALDVRLVFDTLCRDVEGAFIPGGSTGLAPGADVTPEQVALAAQACFGILGPPSSRTPEQADRLAGFLDVIRVSESFVLTDLFFGTIALGDLTLDPGKLNGRRGAGNLFVDYGDREINRSIERVAQDFIGDIRLNRNFTPRGQVRGAKIISIHTSGDGLVAPENETTLGIVTPPQNRTIAFIQEDVPSHCGFSLAESYTAWELLRQWVDGGAQPTPADLQFACQLAVFAGLTSGACRFDPVSELRPLGEVILLRFPGERIRR